MLVVIMSNRVQYDITSLRSELRDNEKLSGSQIPELALG